MIETGEDQLNPLHQPVQWMAYQNSKGEIVVIPVGGGSNAASLFASTLGPLGEALSKMLVIPVM